MPKVREITTYQFDELDDSAKETAREWWRCGGLDYYWWEHVYDDAKQLGAVLGIKVDNIYFSGFTSQGDGACFEGSYQYAKGSAKTIRENAPNETELHRIADTLQAIQRPLFYNVCAYVRQRGHYMHSRCTEIDVRDDYADVSYDVHDEFAKALRDFMNWIYRSLEREYDWLNADEQVDNTIRANEYEFNEDGTMV